MCFYFLSLLLDTYLQYLSDTFIRSDILNPGTHQWQPGNLWGLNRRPYVSYDSVPLALSPLPTATHFSYSLHVVSISMPTQISTQLWTMLYCLCTSMACFRLWKEDWRTHTRTPDKMKTPRPPQMGIKPGTFLLLGDNVIHLTNIIYHLNNPSCPGTDNTR